MRRQIILVVLIGFILTGCTNKRVNQIGDIQIAYPNETTDNLNIEYESYSDNEHNITEPATEHETQIITTPDYETLIDVNKYYTSEAEQTTETPTECVTEVQTTETPTTEAPTERVTEVRTTETPTTENNITQEVAGINIANGHIKYSTQFGDKRFTIDADVIGNVEQPLHTYDFKGIMYTDDEIIKTISDMVGPNVAATYRNGTATADGIAAEVDTRFGYFIYKSYYLAAAKYQYKGKHTETMAPGCKLSVGQCKSIADNIFAKQTLNHYEYIGYHIENQGQDPMTHYYTEKGCYTYEFWQYLDGVPVHDVLVDAPAGMWIRLVDEHVQSICFHPRKYVCTGTYNCIDAKEATNYLSRYIEANAKDPEWLRRSQFSDIYKIMLVYGEGDWNVQGNPSIENHTLVPYWVFINKDKYSEEYAINAITGAVTLFYALSNNG